MKCSLKLISLFGLAAVFITRSATRSAAQMPEQTLPLLQVEGTLQADDETLGDGSFYDVYEFTGEADQSVTILLESEAFDPYLIFEDDDGNRVATNDDISSVNINAALVISFPATGRYRVIAKAQQIEGQGPYRLTIQPIEMNQPNSLLSVAEVMLLATNQRLQAGDVLFQQSEFRTALVLWEEALEFSRTENLRATLPKDSLQSEADALGNIGIAHDALGEYAQALDFHQQSLVIARQLGDRQGEADALGNIGIAHDALSEYAQAIDFYQRSLVIKRQIGDRQGEAGSLGNLALTHQNLGDYERAIDLYQQSLDIAQQIGDRQGEANSLGNLGIGYYALGEYTQAINFHQRSLVIKRQIGNRLGEANSLGNLGSAYYSLGDYAQAINSYQQSLVIRRQIGNLQGEANSLGNLGGAYRALGDYAQAISFNQQSLDIAQQIGDRQGEAASLGNLGNAYISLGDYAQAIDFHQRSLVIKRQIGDRQGEAASLGNLGNAYISLGDYAQAIDFYQQSLDITRQIGDRQGEATSLGNLGTAYFFLDNYEQAIDFHKQLLNVARQIGDRQGEANALGNLGNTYRALGEYGRAIDNQRQSLDIKRQIDDRLGESNSLHNLGTYFLDLDNLTEAERYFQLSAQVQESFHSIGLAGANRLLSLLDSQQSTYHLWQQTLMARSQPESALVIAERGRTQALAASMSRALSKADDGTWTPPTPPDITKIQEIATQQQATLVEYSVLPNGRIFIWVVQPDGTIHATESNAAALDDSLGNTANLFADLGQNGRGSPPPETPLNTLVEDTQSALTTVRGPADATTSVTRQQLDSNLKQLHDLLIEPIEPWLPTDENQHVIFIPHRELFRVPFAALQDSEDFSYLIEKHTILTAPSIQSLDLAHQHSQRIQTANATDALIVGNPTLPEELKQSYGWKPLPGAEDEAGKVGDTLSRYLGTDINVLVTDQATETLVKQRLHDARFIHLATHGTLASGLLDSSPQAEVEVSGDGDSPAASDERSTIGIQYSTIPGIMALAAAGDDDGSLTADELLEMTINSPLNAELVVLSACQTGQGPITSDGVYGLSRTLLTAGVPTLVVSLWNASDTQTVGLMDEFYRQFLEKEQDKAQALRQAMLKMIDKGDDNPQYWAAFTLVGNAE